MLIMSNSSILFMLQCISLVYVKLLGFKYFLKLYSSRYVVLFQIGYLT